MKKKLDLLAEEFFKLHKKEISSTFMDYLYLYLEPSRDISLTTNDVLLMTRKYNLLIDLSVFSKSELNLVYIFCKLASIRRNRKKLTCISKINLRKIALGLGNIEHYDLDVQRREILEILQNNAVIYNKFKNISEAPTMSQLYFYNITKDKIKEFENQVLLLDEDDILLFYLRLKPFIKTFVFLEQINSHFLDTKNPYEFLKFYCRDFHKNEVSLVSNIVKGCTKQLTVNLNEWLVNGQFIDYGKEFFITKTENAFWLSYNIDFGMLPFFISEEVATKILYIGKISNLLQKLATNHDIWYNSKNKNDEDLKSVLDNTSYCDIQILDRNLETLVHERLVIANRHAKTFFIDGCCIMNYLQFCKDTFFFARNDFIENLIYYMKDITRDTTYKQSYSLVLDSAITSSFKRNDKITQTLDLCVLKNDDFSLFCHFDFPVDIVIEKDTIMVFLSIFKYFWRIKRLEHFLRKLKEDQITLANAVIINKWYFLLQKLQFYFFYEVVERHYASLQEILDNNLFLVDELRKGIKRFLKNVINGIFQENGNGKEQMDTFISGLEQECLGFVKHKNMFDDQHIKTNFKEIISLIGDKTENTSLFNIMSYV